MTTTAQAFLTSESGAITVDWVVLSAAIVGMGVASVAAVRTGTNALGADVQSSLSDASVAWILRENLAQNGMFNPAGFNFSSRHYWTFGNRMEGWDILSAQGQRVDIAAGDYFGWTNAYLGPDEYFVDFVGRPGDRLEMQQSFTIADGAPAQVSFMLGAHVPRSGMEVYWGNEMIASFDGSNTPFQRFETFTYDVQGGAGDGSNALRFKATDGDGWLGSMLANVEVR